MIDNRKMAKKAGLVYVTDTSPGFSRARHGKTFRYSDPKGRPLSQKKHLSRIQSLVIPPAWEKVWICADPRGHIQVTGYDVRGRKQYRYHPDWNSVRNEQKFTKMLLFAEKLPIIRKQVRKDLKAPGLGRNKILALVISIMEKSLIRVGNEEYAKANNSFGLTTIRNRHVKVKGAKIVFDFKGKSGKQHHVEIVDQALASVVRKCQDLPGQELFGYVDENGKPQDINSQHVNEYLAEITGEPITAKDFRTWGGTVCAAMFLKGQNPPASAKDLKRVFTQTVHHTSEALRNTPAICRKYYIHPTVFAAFEKGHLVKIYSECKKPSSELHGGLYHEEIFAKRLMETAPK